MRTRLNKFLSQCGLGSRRKVEEFIKAKRISVNGSVITDLATIVDTATDIVTLDRTPLSVQSDFLYLMLNKPKGYITTTADELGRSTIMDLVPEKYRRLGVLPVGRLDRDTEGLLLLTNDGDLSHRLNHPNFKVTKEYYVELDRPLEEPHASRIEEGQYIHQLGLKTRPAVLQFTDRTRLHLTITIQEGKKRQVRYTFKNLGYRVLKLQRRAYGPLRIDGLHRGSIRRLKSREIRQLKSSVDR
ncbi:MAG: rRNA pseudouridine synthase [Spirochaetes bacterium]|nr:rRNA pseudouridine synthase [Spirochaetota bacterium]